MVVLGIPNMLAICLWLKLSFFNFTITYFTPGVSSFPFLPVLKTQLSPDVYITDDKIWQLAREDDVMRFDVTVFSVMTYLVKLSDPI